MTRVDLELEITARAEVDADSVATALACVETGSVQLSLDTLGERLSMRLKSVRTPDGVTHQIAGDPVYTHAPVGTLGFAKGSDPVLTSVVGDRLMAKLKSRVQNAEDLAIAKTAEASLAKAVMAQITEIAERMEASRDIEEARKAASKILTLAGQAAIAPSERRIAHSQRQVEEYLSAIEAPEGDDAPESDLSPSAPPTARRAPRIVYTPE